jgi:hypothetical protein
MPGMISFKEEESSAALGVVPADLGVAPALGVVPAVLGATTPGNGVTRTGAGAAYSSLCKVSEGAYEEESVSRPGVSGKDSTDCVEGKVNAELVVVSPNDVIRDHALVTVEG